ncbi:MAG: hypothetical protein GY722_28970 [bacterium]|nr:hypothetical protein [bacterium]
MARLVEGFGQLDEQVEPHPARRRGELRLELSRVGLLLGPRRPRRIPGCAAHSTRICARLDPALPAVDLDQIAGDGCAVSEALAGFLEKSYAPDLLTQRIFEVPAAGNAASRSPLTYSEASQERRLRRWASQLRGPGAELLTNQLLGFSASRYCLLNTVCVASALASTVGDSLASTVGVCFVLRAILGAGAFGAPET